MTRHDPSSARIPLIDAARAAIADQDGPRVCRIADTLRSRHGWNYRQVMEFFVKAGGDPDTVEGYFYEGDSAWEEGER
jgi:hypothetical protein